MKHEIRSWIECDICGDVIELNCYHYDFALKSGKTSYPTSFDVCLSCVHMNWFRQAWLKFKLWKKLK